MQFIQNIKLLTLIRLEQIYRDFFDINALLGLAIAGFAGYYFQSKYVMSMIDDPDMARIVALFTCVGFAVFVKNLCHRIDENHAVGEVINKYVKVGLGAIIAVFLFGFDAYTSNSAIENSGLEKTANVIESKIDEVQLKNLQISRKLSFDEYQKYDRREKAEGISFKITKRKLRAEIARYDSLIAAVSFANQATMKDANKLRIATVSTDEKAKNSFFGSFLLLLAFGIEMVSTGYRQDRKSAEMAIDRIPYCVSATTMATIYSRRTSLELNHTLTETKHEIPLETVQAILQPKNGDEAVELYARGAIGNGDGWNIRKIARDFFGNENKRTHVHQLVKSRRELYATLSSN